MKIGILTFHRAHNYGAVLQAALAIISFMCSAVCIAAWVCAWVFGHGATARTTRCRGRGLGRRRGEGDELWSVDLCGNGPDRPEE